MSIDSGTDYARHVAALATAQPARIALSAPGRASMTYGELAARADATRATLAVLGIAAGDIVAWPAADRVAAAGALATLPGSCAIAMFDPSLGEDAYAALFDRLRPAAVVVGPDGEHPAGRAALRRGVARVDVEPEANGPAGAFRLRPRDAVVPGRVRRVAPDTVAVIGSSGTTGRAKLVPCRWPALRVASEAVAKRLLLTPDDVSAHLTPLHYANGIRNAFMLAIVAGASVRVLPEADVDAFLAAVEAGEVTYTTASFAIQREVLARLEAGRRVRPARLRFVRVASGPMPGGEMDRLERALGVPVITGLSTTETGTIALQRLPPAPRFRGSCGEPLAAELRIVDAEGALLAQGVTGEIRVRGAQVFDGYLDDDDASAGALRDGWFAPGDLGLIDERGELRVAGRRTELINRGGEKIAPAEIEAILGGTPGVAEAVAFAIPHPTLGQEVAAAVVLETGAEIAAADLIAAVRARIGARRTPRRLWFVASLPRAGGGKLARHRMCEWVGYTSGETTSGGGGERPSPRIASVARLCSALLRIDDVAHDRPLGELGVDIAGAEELRRQLAAVFDVDLEASPARLLASSVAGLAAAIGEAQEGGDADG